MYFCKKIILVLPFFIKKNISSFVLARRKKKLLSIIISVRVIINITDKCSEIKFVKVHSLNELKCYLRQYSTKII